MKKLILLYSTLSILLTSFCCTPLMVSAEENENYDAIEIQTEDNFINDIDDIHLENDIKDEANTIICQSDNVYYENLEQNRDVYTTNLIDNQVLNETGDNDSIPIKIGNDKICKVWLEEYNFYALTTSGDLFIWGRNDYGQIGNGTREAVYIPHKVDFGGEKIVEAGSDNFSDRWATSYAITESGNLYIWGSNNYCQLGDGYIDNASIPHKVEFENEKIVKADISDCTSYALTASGDLYVWGNNVGGQVGNGEKWGNVPFPYKVDLNGEKVSQAGEGGSATYAITTSGNLYMWGGNNHGQTGIGYEVLTPYCVDLEGEKVCQVGINMYDTSYALTESGNLYVWGNNEYGQVGNGSTTSNDVSTPYKLSIINDKISQVNISYNTAYALTESGDLYTWGRNGNGQVGIGTTTTPIRVPYKVDFKDEKINKIETNVFATTSYAITSSGDLYVWGNSSHGQVGDGTHDENVTNPSKINFGVEKISQVGGSSFSSYAITTSGNLYTWGVDYHGELGIESFFGSEDYPCKVNFNGEKISEAGFEYVQTTFTSYAITSSGDLYMWGDNSHGLIGSDTSQVVYTPKLIFDSDYSANESVIRFHSNYNNDEIVEKVYFEEIQLYNSSIFNREGYKIISWNTKPDGTGTNYDIEEIINNGGQPLSLDLYAQWQKITEISGTFDYYSTYYEQEKGEHKLLFTSFDYNDEWFANSSYNYNHDLAKMSLKATLAGADIRSISPNNPTQCIEDLYSKLGYEVIDNAYLKPKDYSVGYIIAKKEVELNGKPTTLVSVVLRSFGYADEWRSNFILGSENDHEGFTTAAELVLDGETLDGGNSKGLLACLEEIKDESDNEIKVWITGYSRGAATSNIIGHKLNLIAYQNNEYGLKPENIYTYTFETPMGAVDRISFLYQGKILDSNIFNIYNKIDLVAKVAMVDMGFGSYGVNLALPNNSSTPDYFNSPIYKNMYKNYKKLIGTGVYQPKVEQYTNQAFIFDTLCSALSKAFLDDRSLYVDNAQSALSKVIKDAFTGKEIGKIVVNGRIRFNNYREIFTIDFNDPSLWLWIAHELLAPISSSEIDAVVNSSYSVTIYGENNEEYETIFLSAKQFESFMSVLKTVAYAATGMTVGLAIVDESLLDEAKDKLSKIGEYVATAHYPELCLAWMEAGDESMFEHVNYNRTKTNCPVDVYAYYKDELVAAIVNDQVQTISNGVPAYVDINGQKVIEYPEDDNYRIEIVSRDEGELNFSVETVDANTEEVLNLKNYYDIEIENDNTFNIDSIDNNIIFKDENDVEITPSISVDNAEENKVKLTIETNENGLCLGEGEYNVGDFVKLSAKPNAHYLFDGWYINDALLSFDNEFRYRIEQDTTIIAKWKLSDDTVAPTINGLSATKSDDGKLRIRCNIEDKDVLTVLATVTETQNDSSQLVNTYRFENIGSYYSTLVDYQKNTTNISIEITAYDNVGNSRTATINNSNINNSFNATNDLRYTVIEDEIVYTGKAIKPEILIYEGSKLLDAKNDYTLSYSKNTNVGTASITVKGKGNYKDTETIEFTIVPKGIEDDDVSISALAPVYYNGKSQKLSPSLKWDKKALKKNADYTLEYFDKDGNPSECIEPGKYNIKITGTGNYSGELITSFEIVSKDRTMVSKLSIVKINDIKYDGDEHEVPLTIKNKNVELIEGQDYELSYSENTIDIGTVSVVIKGINDYVGERTFTYKIVGTSISKAKITGFISSLDYNQGEEVKQNTSLTITSNKVITELIEGTDYTVEYIDNTLPGKATVIYTGINAYSGSVKKTYTIKGLPISKAKIDNFVSSFVYDGNEKKQNPYISYGASKTTPGIVLEEGKDYELSYTKNVDAGSATMVVSGKGLYTGTLKKTFKISKYDIEKNERKKISVYYDNVVLYSKAGTKPGVKVYYGNKLLTEGKDYSISYSYNSSITIESTKNMPTITIKGKESFSGTIKKTFTISPKPLSSLILELSDKKYSTSKNGWKSTVTIYDGTKKLASNTDYDKNISYTYKNDTVVADGSSKLKEKPEIERKAGEDVVPTDIIPAGTIINVEVTGVKNYTGSLKGSYRITKANIADLKVTVSNKTYTSYEVKLDKSDIILKDGSTIVADNQYEIIESSYSNNVNKGKASVTIRGIDNYGGTKTITFTIGSKSLLWWFRELFNI